MEDETVKDKFKQAERILYDYKFIDSKIKIIDLKFKEIENNSTLSAIDYSKDKLSSTNAFSSEVENEVIRRENKTKELLHEKNNLTYRKEIVETFMETLIEDYKQLVKYRYFSKPRLSWQEIAMNMNVSVDTCIRFRRDIIRQAIEYLL